MACSLKDTVSLGRGKCGVGGGLRQLIPSAHRKQRADRKWCQGIKVQGPLLVTYFLQGAPLPKGSTSFQKSVPTAGDQGFQYMSL